MPFAISTPVIRTTLQVAAALSVALLVGACGGEGAAQESGDSEAAATAAAADTIEVRMTDYAYEPSTLTVPAGERVTLAFTNAGSVEHYFVVGTTMNDAEDGFEQNLFEGVALEKTKSGGEEHADEEGGDEETESESEEDHHPNEFELAPGASGSITFTLPPSKAGTYTIACFETTGKKHYKLGMEGTLRVTASDE
jgi:uncharacterized cupredoxin-like copper-binding protein